MGHHGSRSVSWCSAVPSRGAPWCPVMSCLAVAAWCSVVPRDVLFGCRSVLWYSAASRGVPWCYVVSRSDSASMLSRGAPWRHVVSQDVSWCSAVSPPGVQWNRVVSSCGAPWSPVESRLAFLVSRDVSWCPAVSHGVPWCRAVSRCVRWCPVVPRGVAPLGSHGVAPVVSCRVLRRPVMSHGAPRCCTGGVPWCPVETCGVPWCPVVSRGVPRCFAVLPRWCPVVSRVGLAVSRGVPRCPVVYPTRPAATCECNCGLART